MSTLSPDMLSGIVYAPNTHLVWKDLMEHFDNVNRERIFQQYRKITTISQGANSVGAYFTKLKALWAECDALVPSPSCDCPKLKDYIENSQCHRLLQFLSGLNESYEHACRKILMKVVAPI